jgi:Papain family cysteine protease
MKWSPNPRDFFFFFAAVGHGVDQETQEPYFLVKNSWGPKWGDKGFVRMSRNSKNPFGMCAILVSPSLQTLYVFINPPTCMLKRVFSLQKMASFPEVE